ncbi:MAG: hypothetical protein AAFX04_00460 [Pseudomonadota bacterium]
MTRHHPATTEDMRFSNLILLVLAGLLTACAAPLGPTEITRFHLPEKAEALGSGTITIMVANEAAPDAPVHKAFAERLSRILEGQGYTIASDARDSDQIAYLEYRILDSRDVDDRAILTGGGPAAIGTGGSVGLGITVPFGGPGDRMVCQLTVSIEERESEKTLWEARGQSEAKPGSPQSEPYGFADKILSAMFGDFPGRPGETITVP